MSRVRTGGRAEARAHLDKAREFLDAARAALDASWHNAAASSAVLAGINAKDALCFALAGRNVAADDHRAAVNELRALGAPGREPATALDRLLGLKDRAQYDQRGVTATDAQAALRRAGTLVEAVERVLAQ
ncbi:MAG TPA: HEPN domain-containing protein [Candidatus Dormibacteraeota bacterium]